jgi:hypothetical protein
MRSYGNAKNPRFDTFSPDPQNMIVSFQNSVEISYFGLLNLNSENLEIGERKGRKPIPTRNDPVRRSGRIVGGRKHTQSKLPLVPEAGLEPARSFQIEGFSCRTWSPRPTSLKNNVVDGLDYIISQK